MLNLDIFMMKAMIQNGTRQDEKMVIGTVRDIAYRAAHAEMSNPALIIIGEVVRLAPAYGSAERELLASIAGVSSLVNE